MMLSVTKMISLVACALVLLQSAFAQQVSLGRVDSTSTGNTVRDCRQNAETQAIDIAWSIAMKSQGVDTQFMSCMRAVEQSQKVDLVRIDHAGTEVLGSKSCTSSFRAQISNRPLFIQTARDCTFVERVIPVGVLFRADLNDTPSETLLAELNSQFVRKLEASNVRVIPLTGLQSQFQKLQTFQECAITGGSTQEDWRDRCLREHQNYREAREAIINMMRDEFRDYPGDFESWERCGGLIVLGQYSAVSGDYDVRGQLTIDYQSAADWQAPVPGPDTASAKRPLNFGDVETTATSLLLGLTENKAERAIPKISKFINSNGCA